jgi:hypothetical protein
LKEKNEPTPQHEIFLGPFFDRNRGNRGACLGRFQTQRANHQQRCGRHWLDSRWLQCRSLGRDVCPQGDTQVGVENAKDCKLYVLRNSHDRDLFAEVVVALVWEKELMAGQRLIGNPSVYV